MLFGPCLEFHTKKKLWKNKVFYCNVIDLADDWSGKTVPDLYSFVPYTWTINLLVKQFEVVTLANEYNWIDTSSQYQENGKQLD